MLEGLTARRFPGQRQDYSFALQANEPRAGVLALGASLRAGYENRPTTSLS